MCAKFVSDVLGWRNSTRHAANATRHAAAVLPTLLVSPPLPRLCLQQVCVGRAGATPPAMALLCCPPFLSPPPHLASTCSKFVSGVLGSRTSPTMLLAGGLIATAALNVAFGFSTSLVWFCTWWAMNGMLQVGGHAHTGQLGLRARDC